jgi:uncharacterized Ntn-hydrolase superfamily protein
VFVNRQMQIHLHSSGGHAFSTVGAGAYDWWGSVAGRRRGPTTGFL